MDQLTFTSSTNTLTESDVNTILDNNAAIYAPSWYASSPFHATFASNITHIAANCFKNKKVKTVIIPSTITNIGESAFENTHILEDVNLTGATSLTTIPKKCFFNSYLKDINIPSNITTIKESAFSADCQVEYLYQYIFIEPTNRHERLEISEIFVYDKDYQSLAGNGNFIWDKAGGTATAAGKADFYWTESYSAQPSTDWHPVNMVGNTPLVNNADSSSGVGIVGKSKYGYQKNMLEPFVDNWVERMNPQGMYKPYIVIKLNEPKQISYITIQARPQLLHNYTLGPYANIHQGSTSNHNIYLANEDSVSIATMPSGYQYQNYVSATIPWLSGTNYTLISHGKSSESLSWNSTYIKSYYLGKSLGTHSNNVGNFESISGHLPLSNLTTCTFSSRTEDLTIENHAFSNTRLTSITLPDKVIKIEDHAFSNTLLTNIDIPSSVQELGDYVFSDCLKLSTAKIHRFTYDNPSNQITYGANIFNNSLSTGELEIVSTNEWGDFEDSIRKQHYRYIYYERYSEGDNIGANATMSQIIVHDSNSIKISQNVATPTVELLWSSRWEGYMTDDQVLIKGTLSDMEANYWHSDRRYQTHIRDVFGLSNSWLYRAYVGIDFKTCYDIDKVQLFGTYSTKHDHNVQTGNLGNTYIDGYQLYFTNNIRQIPTRTDGSLTMTQVPYVQTVINPWMDHSSIHATDGTWTDNYDSTWYDLYEHTNISTGNKIPKRNIKLKYTILEGVTSIGINEFKDNTNLVSISLPTTLLSIGNSAFYNTGLTNITIPDSVTTLGQNAFSGDALHQKYQYVFVERAAQDQDWFGLDEIEIFDIEGNNISKNGLYNINRNVNPEASGTITTPDGGAFYFNDSYQGIATQAEMWTSYKVVNRRIDTAYSGGSTEKESFGISGFNNQTRAYTPNAFSDILNTDYSAHNGRVTGYWHNVPFVVIKFNEPKTIGKIVINSMRRNEFNNATAQTSNHNIYLTNEGNITMNSMPQGFAAWNHVSPTIPYISGPEYLAIFHYKNYNWTNDVATNVDWGTTNWASHTGSPCARDKTYDFAHAILPTINTISSPQFEYYAYSVKTPLQDVTISNSSSLVSIGANCFKNTKISTINLPVGLTSIDTEAFKESKINSVTLPNGLQTIGARAFHMTDLSAISLPNTVTSVGDFAFGDCKNLATAEIHHYVGDISTNAVINTGKNPFNNPGEPLTITIHSDTKWERTNNQGETYPMFSEEYYQYVIYERQQNYNVTADGGGPSPVIEEFRVDRVDTTSHASNVLRQIWSSRLNNSTWHNNHSVPGLGTGSWHGEHRYQELYNVFGDNKTNTDDGLLPINPQCWIGYDFFSPVEIHDINIVGPDSDPHWDRFIGNYVSNVEGLNGYKIHFTNHMKRVATMSTINNLAALNSVIDRTKPYRSIDFDYFSEDNEWLTNHHATNHPLSKRMKQQKIYFDYRIIDGTTELGDSTLDPPGYDVFRHANGIWDKLISVTLPNTLTSIASYSFLGSGLKQVTIPDTVGNNFNNAFEGATKLESITFPAVTTAINQWAFSNAGLRSLTIPDGVTQITNSSFKEMWYLKTLNLPDSLTSIAQNSFISSNNIESVTIPDSVTEIGDNAFSHTDGKKTMYQYVFIQGITSQLKLSQIKIWDRSGNLLTDNGSRWTTTHYSFQYGSNAIYNTQSEHGRVDLYWTSTYSSLTDNANYHINHIIDGRLGNSTENDDCGDEYDAIVGSTAGVNNEFVGNCFNTGVYTTAYSNNTKKPFICFKFNEPKLIGKIEVWSHRNDVRANNGYTQESANHDIFLTNNVTMINFDTSSYTTGSGANYYTWVLEDHAPYSVPIITGDYSSIIDTYSSYKETVGRVNHKDWIGDYRQRYPWTFNVTPKRKIYDFTIDTSYTSSHHEGDESFVLQRNTSSTDITINGTSSTLTTIGNSAFRGTGNTSFTIPSGITTIGNSAFQETRSLTSITFPSGLTTIGNSAFQETESLTSITIPVSVSSIGEYAFSGCISLQSLTFDDTLLIGTDGKYDPELEIGRNAFSHAGDNDVGLPSIILPNHVKSIGQYAFEYTRTAAIKLPYNENYTTIEAGTFYAHKNSSNFSIPPNVSNIGSLAFAGGPGSSENHLRGVIRVPQSMQSLVGVWTWTSENNQFDTDQVIVLDPFGQYTPANKDFLFNYDNQNSGLNLTGASVPSAHFPGMQSSPFRTGLKNNIDYNSITNLTGDDDWSVAGYTGFVYNGLDLGLRVAPYYTVYNVSNNLVTKTYNDVKIMPGCKKIGIFAVGGGGGGGGGGWAYSSTGGLHWKGGRMGAGSGGSSGGVGFVIYDRETQLPNTTSLQIEVGKGGEGAFNPGGGSGYFDKCGRKGDLGSHTIVRDYHDQNNTPLIQAYRGGTGSGGWIGWDESTATIAHIDGGQSGAGTNDYQVNYSAQFEARDDTVRGQDSSGNHTAPYHGSAPTPDPQFTIRTGGITRDVGHGNNGSSARDSRPTAPLSVSSGQPGGWISHDLNIISSTPGKGGDGGNEGQQGNEGGDDGNAGIVVIFQYF